MADPKTLLLAALLLSTLGFIAFWPLGLVMLAIMAFAHHMPAFRSHRCSA